MKIKKRYVIACIFLCLISVIVNIGIFYLELNLACYNKLNSSITDTWNKTELFVTTVAKKESDIKNDEKISFWGKVTYITNGKYMAYNADKWLNGVLPYYGTTKLGDKLAAYYKPDDIDHIEFIVPTGTYIAGLAVSLAVEVLIIAAAVILSKIMNRPADYKKPEKPKKVKKVKKSVNADVSETTDSEASAAENSSDEKFEEVSDTADSNTELSDNIPDGELSEDDTVIDGGNDADGEKSEDKSASVMNVPPFDGAAGDKRSSLMDIPVCITVAGLVICFFAGMFVGMMRIDESYTKINRAIAEEYEYQGNRYTYGYSSDKE